MQDRFLVLNLPNGLTLLAERMAGVRSAAMTLWVTAGSSNDPIGASGAATVLGEWMLRGAGSRDSRALTDHLDRLGLQRSSSASTLHTRFSCTALAARVVDGLDAYADIVRRPHLREDGFEPSRELALQALAGVEDEPRQKLMIKLRECFWPWPFGRNSMGATSEIEAFTPELLKNDYAARYGPTGAIIAIAGDVDYAQLTDRTNQLFADWKTPSAGPVNGKVERQKYLFEHAKSEQTHIGIAYDMIPETHPDYYLVRLAIEALAGGMSGRLFTEIREKRGLCYAVSASYASLPGMGAITAYSGTSNERAQQTLDQLLVELTRLADGITQAELDRAKTCLKSSTIMSGESTGARTSALAYDFFMRGRVRTMDEIIKAIDAPTLTQVNEFLARNPAKDFTVVLVGPKELDVVK